LLKKRFRKSIDKKEVKAIVENKEQLKEPAKEEPVKKKRKKLLFLEESGCKKRRKLQLKPAIATQHQKLSTNYRTNY
jgi:hypothetical protein